MATDEIDLFLAPSRRLMERHVLEFGIDSEKIVYLDYGFDHGRLKNRKRAQKTFVWIHRTASSIQGIHHLIEAFSDLKGKPILRIWGRSEGQVTCFEANIDGINRCISEIEWLPEYDNENIVRDVFNRCDCIVVPSIWDENSPCDS